MGQIGFEGEPPFELVTQREPIAIADEGIVIVISPYSRWAIETRPQMYKSK